MDVRIFYLSKHCQFFLQPHYKYNFENIVFVNLLTYCLAMTNCPCHSIINEDVAKSMLFKVNECLIEEIMLSLQQFFQ